MSLVKSFIVLFLFQLSFLMYSNSNDFCISNHLKKNNQHDINFKQNKLIDSLPMIPMHTFFIEVPDYNSIFSVNYENSMINFGRVYIVPRIGLNFVPFFYDKKLTEYTLFINTSFQVLKKLYLDAGFGFTREFSYSARLFPLGHFGIKYIGKRGLFLRLSYLECLEPYINIGSREIHLRQIDLCIGYSFGYKKN